MFYQEVKPGVFLSNDRRIHYMLSRCPTCGAENVLSHHKYNSLCVDCGGAYNMYHVRRSTRLKSGLTKKTMLAHWELIKELKKHSDAGRQVPATLAEEYKAVESIVDTYHTAEGASNGCGVCDWCGKVARVRTTNTVHKCQECEDKYARYRQLAQAVNTLGTEGCDELVALVRYYIAQGGMGYRTPYISKVIHKLQRRVQELGGDRQIFYYKSEE